MNDPELHIVTGAYGFSGKYIASRLLRQGCRVATLTNSLNRENPFGGKIEAHPYRFDDPEALTESLKGVRVLYNTYWVRFNHKDFKHSVAVTNTLKLFSAAQKAGVKRIVHISITNPSVDSALEYFRGKAQLEQALIDSGISYAILRPAVLFGAEDILINNIAWMLRHLPLFGMFGDGQYRLQPIYVDDLAQLAVEQGRFNTNAIIDAIGPETFTYLELVQTIGKVIGKKRPILSVAPVIGYWAGRFLGKIVRDVIITREEIEGLMRNLLYTSSAPAGKTRLTDWAQDHADSLGKHYAGELARRRDRFTAYGNSE
jgi:NADH dehydrogenase